MINKKLLYWIFQLVGWSLYIAFLVAATLIADPESLESNAIKVMVMVWLIGLLTSHLYRLVILKLGWKSLRILQIIPRMLFAAVVFSVVFYLIETLCIYVVLDYSILNLNDFLGQASTWFILCVSWSVVYFGFNYFMDYREQEIVNLKLDAANREIELSSLKSQLNPHFMFNSMNSIRALINEDPKEAKDAVTLLANILRNTLLLGKKKKVTLEEEMNIIRDYLQMEKVRFEERLQIEIDLQAESLYCFIPPLMLQTIVENAIKHGIARLPQGGLIAIKSEVKDEKLHLYVDNTGSFSNAAPTGTGIGLANSRKRLELMYGENAALDFKEEDGKVKAHLCIPKDHEL